MATAESNRAHASVVGRARTMSLCMLAAWAVGCASAQRHRATLGALPTCAPTVEEVTPRQVIDFSRGAPPVEDCSDRATCAALEIAVQGDAALPQLLALASSNDARRRLLAMQALGFMGPAGRPLVPAVEEALRPFDERGAARWVVLFGSDGQYETGTAVHTAVARRRADEAAARSDDVADRPERPSPLAPDDKCANGWTRTRSFGAWIRTDPWSLYGWSHGDDLGDMRHVGDRAAAGDAEAVSVLESALASRREDIAVAAARVLGGSALTWCRAGSCGAVHDALPALARARSHISPLVRWESARVVAAIAGGKIEFAPNTDDEEREVSLMMEDPAIVWLNGGRGAPPLSCPVSDSPSLGGAEQSLSADGLCLGVFSAGEWGSELRLSALGSGEPVWSKRFGFPRLAAIPADDGWIVFGFGAALGVEETTILVLRKGNRGWSVRRRVSVTGTPRAHLRGDGGVSLLIKAPAPVSDNTAFIAITVGNDGTIRRRTSAR